MQVNYIAATRSKTAGNIASGTRPGNRHSLSSELNADLILVAFTRVYQRKLGSNIPNTDKYIWETFGSGDQKKW